MSGSAAMVTWACSRAIEVAYRGASSATWLVAGSASTARSSAAGSAVDRPAIGPSPDEPATAMSTWATPILKATARTDRALGPQRCELVRDS